MAFHAIPQAVMAEVRWLLDSQKCENRIYVDVFATPTTEIISNVSDIVAGWVVASYVPHVNGAVRFTDVVVTDASNAVGIQQTTVVDTVGSLTGAMLPNETSFAISLRTGLRGRSGRGRWFLPPPQEDERSGINLVTGTYATNRVAMMQDLIDNLATAGFRACVVQQFEDKVRLTPPIKHHYTVASSVDLTLDSMRSRKPGNGS